MKTINKLSKLFTLTITCILILGLVACTNLFDTKIEKAYVNISASTQNMRTVLPTDFTPETTGLTWTLSGTKDNTSVTFENTWSDTINKTAYENMTSDTFLIPETGSWTFTLIAQIDSKDVLYSKINKNIVAGQNTLSFAMSEATSDNLATGEINFTLTFPSNIVSHVKASLYKYNGTDFETAAIEEYFQPIPVEENSENITYEKTVEAGYYRLRLELYQIVNIRDTKINTYSTLVRVAPGLCSTGSYQIKNLAQLFTVTYNPNRGIMPSNFTSETNGYTSFTLPTPTREGYNFVGWFTDEECNTAVSLDNNGKYTLTSDIELYAKWEAIPGTLANPITNWDDLVAVMSTDGGDVYISGDFTANKTITINFARKIIAKEPVTITRDSNFTDKLFTTNNADFTLQGSENARITIDGNNIEAPYALYSNSYMITLKYVTIQNCRSNELLAYAIYAGNGINLENCILINNNNYYNSSINLDGSTSSSIKNCSFNDESSSDLTICSDNSVEISNTSFLSDGKQNIVITNCPNLILGENLQIPQIQFSNFATRNLDINCTSTSLLNEDIPINIILAYYQDTDNSGYDLKLFNLSENETVPEGLFVLDNSDYTINLSTGLVESNTPSNISGITYAGRDTETGRETFNISDLQGLVTFRNIVNGTLTSAIIIPKANDSVADLEITSLEPNGNISAVLMNDIDLQNVEWTPIGTAEHPFAGDFKGYSEEESPTEVISIKNLQITNATTSNQGLFGVIEGDSTYKSHIYNLSIDGNIRSSESNVGGFAGTANNVEFEYCENNITITTSSTNVGGIAGTATNSEFSSCVNLANIESTDATSEVGVGGIAGYISNTNALCCYNKGDITGNQAIGGIFGYETNNSSGNQLVQSINIGTITGNSRIGGILGYSSTYISITASANYGTINAEWSNTGSVGCILGESFNKDGYISDCLAVGNVITNGGFSFANNLAQYSVYDSNVLEITQEENINGYSTEDLITGDDIDEFYLTNWSYEEGRYPIPDIEEYLAFIPGLWNDIVQAATPTDIGGGTGGGATALDGTAVNSEAELTAAIADTSVDTIIIASDITLTNAISITKTVTIASNENFTLTQPSGAKNLFSIGTGGNLTLGGGTGTLTLKGTSSSTNSILYLNKTGILTIKDNCIITGTSNSSAANAIQIFGGTFYMSGGEITENTAGSAITTNKNQTANITMNIYGGKIYNNSGASNGGAVNIVNASDYSTTVNIYGSVQIYNNKASSYGGSIYITGANNILNVNSHETEEYNNASIYDNNKGSSNDGASIYRNTGTFYLNKEQKTESVTTNINKPE